MQIQTEIFFSPLTYSQYLKLFDEEYLLKMPEHLQGYTRLNAQRMHRWEKTYQPDEKAQNILASNETVRHAFIITEPWCGDAAHCIPALHKLLLMTSQVATPIFILRDSNLETMDNFLTNGNRSIPILILTDAHYEVLGKWGPRPEPSQIMVDQARKSDVDKGKWKEKLQNWYNHDKQFHLESEFVDLIRKCNFLSKNC
ncbi:MAG: thioredoxin family protein [Flavobacteriales bacterium]